MAYIKSEGAKMKNILKLDLEGLPEEARLAILDFYEYIKSKYHSPSPKRTSPRSKKDLFSVMKKGLYNLPADYKFDREELYY